MNPPTPPPAASGGQNDVFVISGENIPESFTEHLRGALVEKGISAFYGDQLEPGEPIGPSVFKPIKESICAIVIFSPSFANSTWCLDGLAKAVERMRMPEGIAPVFYDVDARDVKYQTGSFGKALSQLEQRLPADQKRSRKWRSALKRVGNINGWYPQKSSNEGKCIQQIVKKVVKELAARKEQETRMSSDQHIFNSSSDIEENRLLMNGMEERGEKPPNCRMATSTEWIFLLTNIGLEISSAMFDQFSSESNKPRFALISMVLAALAVIISILELIHKGKKEEVEYKRLLVIFGWFYSPGDKIFGSVPDICGLLGSISQWIYSTVQYVCILRHIENPYKIYLWPIIFILCVGASRLHWNQRNMTNKVKQ